MYKAGGILGIIGGVFGFLAAVFTLFFGGLGSALDASGAQTVIGLGWGGVLFSFLAIVLGAVAFARPRGAGIGLLITAVLGVVLGGTLVAVCMALVLVGGVLCLLGAGKAPKAAAESQTEESGPVKKRPWLWLLAALPVLLIVLALMSQGDKKPEPDPLADIAAAQPEPLNPGGELAAMFDLGSDYTDLQRENALKKIKGRIVQWRLPVYEVSANKDGYKIQTSSHSFGQSVVGAFVYVTPRDDADRRFVESLKTGDPVHFKGRIDGVFMRSLIIRPAMLARDDTPAPEPSSAPAASPDRPAPSPAAEPAPLTPTPPAAPSEPPAPAQPEQAAPSAPAAPQLREVVVVGVTEVPGTHHGSLLPEEGYEALSYEMVPELGYKILESCPVGTRCVVKARVNDSGLAVELLSVLALPPMPEKAPAAPEPPAQTPAQSPAPAVRPSFDCAKAGTAVEKAVCADAGLAQLDQAMAALYKRARAGGNKEEALLRQRLFLTQMNAKCDSMSGGDIVQCVRECYEKRLEELARNRN